MMHFLKAIDEFSIKKMARLVVPEAPALVNACKGLIGAARRPEVSEDRIRRIVAEFKAGRAASLNRRDVRFVTAAIGSSDLVGGDEVRAILAEIERRKDVRLFRAVLGALLSSYREQELRSLIRPFMARHLDSLRPDALEFCKQSRVTESGGHLDRFASKLAEAKDICAFCVSNCLNSGIASSNYGTELKLAAIRKVVELGDEMHIKECLDWSFSGESGTPIGDYYEAMLSPFEKEAPPQAVQKLLISQVVAKYRDPRLYVWPGLRGKDGMVRRDRCIATIKRWLSIEYLDLFIRIIESTAVDRQFKPRKAFWLKYFQSDAISDVTLILAADANKTARRMRNQMDNTEYMQWANLIGTLANQSVLLMRLGDLIIAEWSHSGAMRFWKANDKSAPAFHSKQYLGSELRSGGLKIKVGNEMRASLIHHENGNWMKWASLAIKHNTGVSV